MESLVTDPVQFSCTSAKFSFFRTEHWAMPFSKVPHFLRSKVLSCLALRDTICIFKFW